MRNLRRFFFAATFVLALSACSMPGTFWDGENVQVVQLHAEWELEQPGYVWEVSPPTRLDIIMWPDSLGIYQESAQIRCASMGGTLVEYKATVQFICQGIDY